MDGPEPAFTLSLSGGRAAVVCRGQRHGPILLRHLEMEVPDVRFPLDLSGGPQQFRRRWCAVRNAEIEVAADDLRPLLLAGLGAPLGLESLDVVLRDGSGLIFGRARSRERVAEFTARIALERAAARGVLLSLFDVRLYGPIDLPSRMLAIALLAEVSGRVAAPGDERHEAAGEVELRPLDDLLERFMPNVGWRVPDRRGACLAGATIQDGRVVLSFGKDAGEVRICAGQDLEHARRAREARNRYAAADQLLARGDVGGALGIIRSDLLRHPEDDELVERAVSLLACSPQTRAEAEPLARRLMVREPSRVQGLLALAALLEERGDLDEAATRYDEATVAIDGSGAPEEQIAARLAAARCHEPSRPDEAANRLEEVLRRRADHQGALEGLDRIYGRIGRQGDRVRILHRRAALTFDAPRSAELRVALGRLYVESLDDLEMGRLEIERALALQPDAPVALAALADVCVRRGESERAVELFDRLARAALAERQPAVALEALLRAASLLEANAPEDAMARLRQAVEIDPARGDVRLRLARRAAAGGQWADAVDSYEGALAHLDDAERAAALAEMADLRASGGDLRAAHAPIWRALGVLQPPATELALLELALRAAEVRGDREEAADVLARIAQRADHPSRRGSAMLRRGELLAELPERSTEAASVFEQAARAGAEGAIDALERLADRISADRPAEARAALEALTALGDLGAADRARLRLAGIAELGGDTDAARALLEDAARGETEVDALRALRRVLSRSKDGPAEEAVLLRLLRLEPENVEVMNRRADVLVSMGRLDEAGRQIETLLGHCPDTERAGWLMRLGAIAEGTGQARQAFGRYREALAAGLEGARARETYDCLRRLAADRRDWELAARLARAEAEDAVVGLTDDERVDLLIEAATLWRERAERPQEAEACLRRALDSIPDHDRTLQALEDLLRAIGDRARVAEIVERRAQAAAGQPERELALLLDLAALRLALGQSDGARYAFMRCVSLLPTCKPALLGLGKLALERGDEQEARTHLAALAAQVDHDALVLEARRLLARLAAAGGGREEAEALRALLEVEEDPAERFRVASRIGELSLSFGSREDALAAYRRALETDPDHPLVLWAIARLMGEAGRFREHADALERLLGLPAAPGVPDAPALTALLRELYGSVPEAALSDPAAAAQLAGQNKLAELASLYAEEAARRGSGPAAAVLSMQAARLYEGPLGLAEAAAEAWFEAARADAQGALAPALRAADLLATSDPGRAAEALALAVAVVPAEEAAEIRFRRADALLLAGRATEAVADLRAAVAADPGMFLARAQLGEVLLGLGDRQGAIAHLAAAAEGLAEDFRAAHCAMLAAQALWAMDQPDGAVALWETAAARAPQLASPLLALLGIAEGAQNWPKAADLARRAAERTEDPVERAALEARRAASLRAAGRGDEAYQAACQALRLDWTQAEARQMVRAEAEARADWPQLAALFRDELETEGDAVARAQAGVALGGVLERSAEIAEAAAAYEQAAALDAGLRAAHEGLLRIHRAAGRFADAARAAEHLVSLASSPEEEGRLAFDAGALRIRAGDPDAARLLLAYACERPGLSGDKALLALARLANDPAKRRQVRDLARIRLREHPAPEEQATLLQKLTDHFAKTAGREEAEALARELRASGEEGLEEITVEAVEAPEIPEQTVEEISLDALDAEGEESDLARGARNEVEGRTLAARAAYARVLQQDPDHLEALDALADLAFRDGDLALAGALYDRLAGRGTRVGAAELECRRGSIAESRGDPDALEHFQNALRHDPAHGGAIAALARLDLGSGDAAAALVRLRELLGTLDPEDVAGAADLRERMAGLQIAAGDEAGARADLLEVLRTDPYRESALAPLVELFQNAGDWWEAASALERLAGVSPDTTTRVERLARLAEVCFSCLGDARRAIETLLRAADLADDPAPLLLRLADLHWETGDLESMVEVAPESDRALVDPGPRFAARLAIALAVRGRGDEARRTLAGSLVESIAEALCDAAERDIDLASALSHVAPTRADREALLEALRTRAGVGAERVVALLQR